MNDDDKKYYTISTWDVVGKPEAERHKEVKALLSYMVDAWDKTSGDAEEIMDGIFLFYTGGWSKNEMILNAFYENIIISNVCPKIEIRGALVLLAVPTAENYDILFNIEDAMIKVFWEKVNKLKLDQQKQHQN